MPKKLAAAVVLVACFALPCLYLARHTLKQAAVAVSIYRLHIFTAPPHRDATRWQWWREQCAFYWDFAGMVAARDARLERIHPTLTPLVDEIARRQAAGDDMRYSMHIYRQVRWLLNFTPDVQQTHADIDLLRQSLTEPAKQAEANQEQPDGSWAMGITDWYLRLYYSVDQIEACHGTPAYPLRVLDPVNTPAKLRAVLEGDLHDRFAKTGVFNREMTDETFSALARILFQKQVTDCYPFDPQLAESLRQVVDAWQNPATGCWGQWLVDRQGQTWKMDDMGMTFHVVSDLHGQVRHLDRIAGRLLELREVNFPAGLRFHGHDENHLNADAVVIFRYAWPAMSDAERARARQEIARMLKWSLTESLNPDGSFKTSELDDTTGDAYEYGVWFLNEAGYYDRRKRFWTDESFPESGGIRAKIAARLRQTGLDSPQLKGVYEALTSTQ